VRILQRVRFRSTDQIIKGEMTTAELAVVISQKSCRPTSRKILKNGAAAKGLVWMKAVSNYDN